MRNALGGFALGILVMVLGLLILVRNTHKEEPMVEVNRCRYLETLSHPDCGSKMALLEVITADRAYEPYYVSVLLSDWQACYTAPSRVYRAPTQEAARKTWLDQAKAEVENAVQCVFAQNPEVGFGSKSKKP